MSGICGTIPDKQRSNFKRFDQISTGIQPIPNEDRSVWVFFDGAIYNFRQLRKELEASGHYFQTKAEAEGVVHAYEAYGQDCLSRLQGEFAFAIWDEKQDTLVLARDRLGTKPLLYTYENGQFFFASDFNSILANSGLKREVNLSAIHHYLSYSYVPAPLTAFKGIYKLLPGHKLIISQRQSKY